MACVCTRRYASSRSHAGFGEIEQQLAAEDQAAGAFEIAQHPRRIDEQVVDER